MYAVVQVGLHQFKVVEGDTIQTDRLKDEAGKSINLDQVVLYANDSDVRVGQPYLKDVKVTADVVNHVSGKKVQSLKYRRRLNHAKTLTGHRKKLTTLNITKIAA